jgi:lon-related putative ATP-dependent protease
MLGMISTVSLEPEPIPLNLKVALIGDRLPYNLLAETDPDFNELFKVQVDFDELMPRDTENQELYAQVIASLAQKQGLKPFDQAAVARVIEHSARLADDSKRLSAQFKLISDLLCEADYWAKERGNKVIQVEDVQQAIDEKIYRSDRIRERIQENILRDTILISTEGGAIGQINGLSVLQMGALSFGIPSRITARVHRGKGDVINIEREVEMSGPIHSKGVLILSGFLGARYAAEHPLSLSASLVFEQSYSGIEGDSASSAELYALLSALAETPINQSLAVTGSVNQHGLVQAIGGVNEKIEGFFDICKARGLSGKQGVLIPQANVKNLMLRKDVVDAVANNMFNVYPINTIDEGIEILTGISAGTPNENGEYPLDSINGRVQARLTRLAEHETIEANSEEENNP